MARAATNRQPRALERRLWKTVDDLRGDDDNDYESVSGWSSFGVHEDSLK